MRQFFSVTVFTGLLTLLRMISGFIIVKVVAVYAGASGIALLGQLQSLTAIFNGVVNAPGGNAVVRYTSQYGDRGYAACAPWWRASLKLTIILILILFPIGVIFSRHIALFLLEDSQYWWLIVLITLLLPLSACSSIINSVLNGGQKYRTYILLGVISVIFSTCLMLLMVYYFNIKGALIASSIQGGCIGSVMLFFSLKQPWLKIGYWWGKTSNRHRRKVFGYLIMALTSAIAGPLSLMLVRKIIVGFLGWDSAGQWQVVWKISEVYLSVITIALGTYYLPRLSKLSCIDHIHFEIKQTLKIVFPIVCLMAFFIYLTRELIIKILFTSSFNDAEALFSIQLIGDIFKIISWLYAFPMVSRGATKWFVTTEIVFSISFVVLTYFLISIFSLQGVNVAYLINYILYFLFVFINLKRFAR